MKQSSIIVEHRVSHPARLQGLKVVENKIPKKWVGKDLMSFPRGTYHATRAHCFNKLYTQIE